MSVWVDRQVAMDGYLSIPLNGRTSAMFDYSTYFSAQSYTKHFIIASFMYVFTRVIQCIMHNDECCIVLKKVDQIVA